MANRYYIGPAGGAWNNNNNWDAVSGGPGPASFPVAGDNAFLDAASPGGPTLTAAAVCDQFDCTGFIGTLDLGGFTLQINTTLFKLDAGMTFVAGAAVPAVDFVAVAGTVLITSAGKDLGSIRCGNAGAGGTFQLQDALTLARDLDLVSGTFQFNNQNANIGRDLYCRATMAAAGCALGSGTITVTRDAEFRVLNVISAGTSTFRMPGTGALRIYGNTGQTFYNLYLADNTKTITFSNANAVFGGIIVGNILTTGPGALVTGGAQPAYWNSLTVQYRTGGPAIPIQMDPATTMTWTPSVQGLALGQLAAGQTGTWTVQLPTILCPFVISSNTGGTAVFNLGRSCTVASFSCGDGSSSPAACVFDLNGFNLATVGAFSSPPSGQSGYAINIGNSVLTVGTDLILDWCAPSNIAAFGYYMNIGPTGQVLVGRDFFFNRVANSTYNNIVMVASSLMTVGRNWDSGNVNNKLFTFKNPDLGTVNFTAAGPYTIATQPTELLPTVGFTGGGSTTLPNFFNCYNMNVTAGLITPGPVFTVRALLTNNGTINFGSGTSFIGGGIINTGTLNGLATANIVLNGPLERLSGFNPVNLTMGPTCVRLQLESAMTITNFTIADRPNPGIVVYKASTIFSIATFNSQVQTSEGCVQFVSSVPNTQYVWKATAITRIAHVWPRDCDASASPAAPVGDLSNKDLGNNLGWTLNTHGFLKVITDDVGADRLSELNIGNPIAYCWLVDTTLVGLTAKAAAFAAGAKNWHRKTGIPYAMLDNLNIGATYFIALGIIDDRDRVVAPSVGAGDYVSLVVTQSENSGGGGPSIHNANVNSACAFVG